MILFTLLLSVISSGPAAAWAASNSPPLWDLNLLNKPPKMKWLSHNASMNALEYQGLHYKGKPTTIFAYYATPGSISGNPALDKNLPAVILIHAGKGHALETWVTSWARFGYAALSMDLSGCCPDQGPMVLSVCGPGRKPMPNAVPVDDLLNYDWNYHAVANVILAHSLLRSFEEVNPDRTAVSGISVGGQITCIVAGLDKRFKAAVPVYGCGYLHESSLFSIILSNMDKTQRDKWVRAFDPSGYLVTADIPMLFVTGADDPFYPLDSYAKTCRLGKGLRNFCIVPGIPHHEGVAASLVEPALFIDQVLRNGIPLPSIDHPVIESGKVNAKFFCKTKPLSASLYYTTDSGAFKDRKWNSYNASIAGSAITCNAPPKNTTAWLVTLSDERKATVSSEIVFP